MFYDLLSHYWIMGVKTLPFYPFLHVKIYIHLCGEFSRHITLKILFSLNLLKIRTFLFPSHTHFNLRRSIRVSWLDIHPNKHLESGPYHSSFTSLLFEESFVLFLAIKNCPEIAFELIKSVSFLSRFFLLQFFSTILDPRNWVSSAFVHPFRHNCPSWTMSAEIRKFYQKKILEEEILNRYTTECPFRAAQILALEFLRSRAEQKPVTLNFRSSKKSPKRRASCVANFFFSCVSVKVRNFKGLKNF